MATDSVPQSGISTRDLGKTGIRGLFARAFGCSHAPEEVIDSVGHALFGETRELGRYQLGELLGSGGFGVVRAAFDPVLRRDVAIKLLRRKHATGSRGVATSLAREARSLARVRHPNVVEVFDVGLSGDTVFIVMQLVRGVPLSSWLAHRPARPIAEIVAAFREAGRGLEAIHAGGLLHRDFKPGNVLVGDGTVKIVDFGLAELLSEHEDVTTGDELDSTTDERPWLGAGTPLYMPPEQHQGRRLDPRADVYAFSLALLEALLGAFPFAYRSLAGLVREKLAERHVDPHDVVGLPPAMARAIAWGLRADPRKRCPSMHALLAALDERRDRRGPARTLAGLGAAAVLLLGTVPASGSAPCEPDTAAVAGDESPWSTRRRELARTLGAAGPVEDAIVARMDDWGGRWVAAQTSVCDGAIEERPLVRACLDRELAEFVAGLDALPSDHPQALALLGEARDPSHCLVPGEEAPVPPELDEHIRRARVHARTRELDALTDDVAAIGDGLDGGDPRLEASLEHWRSLVARHRQDLSGERMHLERSHALARAARSDELAYRTALQLAASYAVIALDDEQARHWLRAADATAPLELGAMTRARRLHVDLRIALRAGEYDRMAELGETALAELEAAGLLRTPIAVEIRNAVIEGEVARGRFDGLEPRARAALDAALELRGPDAYEVAHARVALGRLLASTDRLDEAARELELAKTFLVASGESMLIGQVHNTLAHIAAARRDLPAAIESYRAAIAAFPAEVSADRGLTLMNLAAAEIFAGRIDDGEAHLDRAAIELEDALDERHPWRAHLAGERAGIAVHRKAWPEAAALAEQAAHGFARHYGESNWMAADMWITVAHARLATGDATEALAALAQADRSEGAPESMLVTLELLRARVLAALGRLAAAREALAHAERRLPTLDVAAREGLDDDLRDARRDLGVHVRIP